MKCIVPGINLKVFGRAIHSLAKIGEELYFEPLEQGLSLRTVNSSRSAYACFLFFPSYFQHYDDGRKQTEAANSEEEDEGLRCKILMKSIMAVFRSLSTIEKTVEKCKISYNAKEARLVFELHCRHGIVKKHNLAYIECETLQAIFSKDLCPNKLTAPSKLLCEVVVSFQTTQEEITLTVRPDILSLKNYVEDEPDPNKVVHTELSLAPEEFDLYQVGVDTEITFCLKELRAILAFGETTGLPLNINFEAAGRPVTFCIDSDQSFEANFVLATLADAEQSSSQVPGSQRVQQSAAAHQAHRKTSAPASTAGAVAKQKDNTGTARKTPSLKRPHTNGTMSAPRRNKEQQSDRNGPLPSNEALCDDEDMVDISAEDLAAAMEVEQEWEKAERGGPQAERHPPTREAERDRPSRSQDKEREKSPQRLSTKRDSQGGEKEKSSRKQEEGRERLTHIQERHRPSGNQAEDRDGHSHTREEERQRASHSRKGDRDRPSRNLHGEREQPSHSGAPDPHAGGERRGDHRVQTRMEEGEEDGVSSSPVFPVQCTSADVTRQGACLQPVSEEEDDLDDTIPGTPPSTPPAKKFRSLFFGSSQKSTRPRHTSTVLAADTDEED